MTRRLIALRLALRGLQKTDLRYVVGYDEAVRRADTAERERDQVRATLDRVRAIVPELDGAIQAMEDHRLPLAVDLRYDLDRLKTALDQPGEPT